MYKWGNPLWHLLYVIAKDIRPDINPNEKKIMMMFLKHVVTILPCEKCRFHYKKYFDDNIGDYNNINKEYILDWLYNLDMSIKKENGQPLINKDIRIAQMGTKLDRSRLMELLLSIRTFFYTNGLDAKDIYIFLIYLSILLPDNNIRYILNYRLDLKNGQFDKLLFDNIIHRINS